MLQLDYMMMDGRIVQREIMDEGYWMAKRLFRKVVAKQECHLVYLWLVNEEEAGDSVILERWVRT